MAADDSVSSILSIDPVLDEARKRFDRVAEWESMARQRFMDDLRFANADSENGYQWPNAIRQARDTDSRPCLTLNITKQHNRMISNEARKNKSSPKFIGMGNGATQESANVFMDVYRHIEAQSQAQLAYALAREYMIDAGIGWWRIATDYTGEDSFDQEIYIQPINDPLSVYMDPDVIQTRTCLDSKWALVFDEISEEEFNETYPKFKGIGTQQPLGIGSTNDDWVVKKMVRVAEYFRKVPGSDKLVSFMDKGKRFTLKQSVLRSMLQGDEDHFSHIVDHPMTRVRDIIDWKVEWYLIAAEQIIDKTLWAGKYIPLIPCKGDESVIDGMLDRKGHTRYMKDAQRMYNYNASAQVEFVALQGKTPWIAPAKAIEGFESMWNTANTTNHSVLVYHHTDPEAGEENQIPPPARTQPPTASSGYEQGMQTAFTQMMMTSGQWQNQMGMMGNERTGAAIQARQRQGDTATFHFQDYYEEALIATATQIIDLVPKIYDTKRVMRVLAEDGVEYDLEIDPSQRASYLQHIGHRGEVIKRIFNPQIGKYDVAPSVGPSYGTKREETRDALTLILTQAPTLTGVIGDLLMASMDFDKAQEAAARMRRMVPPVALGNGPTQQEQQLMQQVQALQSALAQSLQKQAKDQVRVAGKDQLRDIEAYDAETKRMHALAKMLPMDSDGLQQLIEQLVNDALTTSLKNVTQATTTEEEPFGNEVPKEPNSAIAPQMPNLPGMRQAKDGYYYLADPTRKGKYLKVEPLAMMHRERGTS